MSSNESTTSTVINDEQKATTPVDKKMRIVIERHPNPDMTTFKFDRVLTASGLEYHLEFVSGEVQDVDFMSATEDINEIEDFIVELARKVFAVPGVLYTDDNIGSVTIDQYTMDICKSRAINDSDIERGVIEAVAEMFDLTVDELDVTFEAPTNYFGGMPSMNLGSFEDDSDEDEVGEE
jgi:hypothetical protein